MTKTIGWVALVVVAVVAVVSGVAFEKTWAQSYTAPGSPTGSFQVVSPKENYAWRINTTTGELWHCFNGPNGPLCVKAR